MLRIFPRLLAFILGKRVVVQGWSMHPTLAPEERVLFDRLAYRRKTPRRGDIVLVRHPQRPEMLLIKRIAGVQGDTVAPSEAGWQINSSLLADSSAETDALNQAERALATDEYFLLGDQPDHSTDSRHFGPVHRGHILGRARLVYWPPGRFREIRD